MPATPEPHPWTRVPFPIRRVYEYWIYLSSLALFGIGGLFFSVLAFAIYFVLPHETGKRLGRRSLTVLFRFFRWYVQLWGLVTIDVDEVDALADQPGIVIAPNHISLYDVVFIISQLPNVVCIAKSAVMRNPIYGGFARLAGFIPNDSPAAMVKHATAELKSGARLLIFPEGTRMKDPPIQPFKGGFALIAKKAAAPIHTLLVCASSPVTGKGWPLLKAPTFPLRYRISQGQRFEIPSDLDVKTFVEMLEQHFRQELPPDPRNANLH